MVFLFSVKLKTFSYCEIYAVTPVVTKYSTGFNVSSQAEFY